MQMAATDPRRSAQAPEPVLRQSVAEPRHGTQKIAPGRSTQAPSAGTARRYQYRQRGHTTRSRAPGQRLPAHVPAHGLEVSPSHMVRRERRAAKHSPAGASGLSGSRCGSATGGGPLACKWDTFAHTLVIRTAAAEQPIRVDTAKRRVTLPDVTLLSARNDSAPFGAHAHLAEPEEGLVRVTHFCC
jgi:hypothetical protein